MKKISVMLFCLCSSLQAGEKSRLVVSATPMISIMNESPVLIMAKITGEETEDYYCPALELWLNKTRVKSQESDCPPFEKREDYPRFWIWYVNKARGDHEAEVRLLKNNRLVAKGSVTWRVVDSRRLFTRGGGVVVEEC